MLTVCNAILVAWLLAAVALRRRHALHAGMTTLGFSLDLALLLYVEFNRQAIATALGGMTTMLAVHVAVATLTALLWPVLLFSGGRVLAGGSHRLHRAAAGVFLLARIASAITAWLATGG